MLSFRISCQWHAVEQLSFVPCPVFCRCMPRQASFFGEQPSACGRTLDEALARLPSAAPCNKDADAVSAGLCLEHVPRASAHSTTLAIHMQHPALFWASTVTTSPGETSCTAASQTITARRFARGGDLLVVLEPKAIGSGLAMSVHWPWQNVLAGEAQFAQLMYTIFGNLGELGDVTSEATRRKAAVVSTALPVLPRSLALKGEPVAMVINVCMQRTFFDIEAHATDSVFSGQGPELARMHLSDAHVQVRITKGAHTNTTCIEYVRWLTLHS